MNRGFLAIFIAFLILSLVLAVVWNVVLDLRTRSVLDQRISELVREANSVPDSEALTESRTRFREMTLPPGSTTYELSGHPVSERDDLVARAQSRLKRQTSAMDALFDALRVGAGEGRLEDITFLKLEVRTAAYVSVTLAAPHGKRTVRFVLIRRFDPTLRGTTDCRRWVPDSLLSWRSSFLDTEQKNALEQCRASVADADRSRALLEHLLPPVPVILPESPIPAVAFRADLETQLQVLVEALATALEPRRQQAAARVRSEAGGALESQLRAVAAALGPGGALRELQKHRSRQQALTTAALGLPGELLRLTEDNAAIQAERANWRDLERRLTELAGDIGAVGVPDVCQRITACTEAILEAERPLRQFNVLSAAADTLRVAAETYGPLRQTYAEGTSPPPEGLEAARLACEAARHDFETQTDAYLALVLREDRDRHAKTMASARFARDTEGKRLEAFFRSLSTPEHVAVVKRAGQTDFLLSVSGGSGVGFGVFSPGAAEGGLPRLTMALDREADYLRSYTDVSEQLRDLYNRERQQEENPDAKEGNALKETVRALTPFLGRVEIPAGALPAAAPPGAAGERTPEAVFAAWLGFEQPRDPIAVAAVPPGKRLGLDDFLEHLAHDTVAPEVQARRRTNAAAAFLRLTELSFSVGERLAAIREQVPAEAGDALEPLLEDMTRLAGDIRGASNLESDVPAPGIDTANAPRSVSERRERQRLLDAAKHSYRVCLKAIRTLVHQRVVDTTALQHCKRHLDALGEMLWIDCQAPELRAGGLYVIKKTWLWAREAAPDQGYDRIGVVLKVRFKGLRNVTRKRTESNVYQYEKEIAHQDWYVTLIAHEKAGSTDGELHERRVLPIRFQPAEEPLDRAFLEAEIRDELQRRTHGRHGG